MSCKRVATQAVESTSCTIHHLQESIWMRRQTPLAPGSHPTAASPGMMSCRLLPSTRCNPRSGLGADVGDFLQTALQIRCRQDIPDKSHTAVDAVCRRLRRNSCNTACLRLGTPASGGRPWRHHHHGGARVDGAHRGGVLQPGHRRLLVHRAAGRGHQHPEHPVRCCPLRMSAHLSECNSAAICSAHPHK